MGTDDLTPFLLPPPDGAGVRYGQGKLTAWNPTTFENTVLWRGAALHNLPVLAGPAALTFVPGQVVALIGWAPGGGAGSWTILGQWVTPGSGAAEAQIEFMTTALAKAVAADISAANITSATAAGTQTRADTSGFEELPGGPSLTVDVSETGKVIVHLSASIVGTSTDTFPDPSQNGGRMAVALSGANTAEAEAGKSVAILAQVNSVSAVSPFPGNSTTIQIGGRLGTTFDIAGLTPGPTTFTAMYARLFSGFSVDFTDRTIVVVRS